MGRRDGTPEAPDGAVLARWRAGDAAAFETLVDRWQGTLLGLARAVAGSAAAEDLVQETFLRLIRQGPEVAADGALGAWLCRVCRNLALDRIKMETRERHRRRQVARPEAQAVVHPVEGEELRALAARELEALPWRQREAVRLKVQEGRSYREIGELTGQSAGVVGWLVHQGLERLAARLRRAGALA